MIVPSQGMIDSSELARLTCIYCNVTLSDAESANGGKICDTCAYDNGDHCIEEDQDDVAEAEMDCGLGHDGQCSQAGTEHCDFVCPFRNSEDFVGSAAWNKKHSKPVT